MKSSILIAAPLVALLALSAPARADTYSFGVSGAGLSGTLTLSVSPDTVAGDPAGAYTIDPNGISGVFSDSNVGISNAAITGLVPIAPVSPSPAPPIPVSLSFLPVLNPPPFDTAVSYDNLFYPGGSPITCTNYGLAGGWLDVYGLMFTLDNGDAVDLYSNGEDPNNPLSYGAVVIALSANGNQVIDSPFGGVALPEPVSAALLLAGLAGLVGARRARRAAA